MPDTDSITIVQKFSYRGAPEEFSNTYHLDGTTPTDDAGWKDVADDLIALLAPLFGGDVKFVRAYGYEAGNDHAVSVIDYATLGDLPEGSFSPGSAKKAPGDAAMTCRWWTGATNSRGKKIYLRKYFHDVYMDVSDADKVYSGQLTALQTFADALLNDPISGDLVLVGPQGANVVNADASQWITTRTLKRRGRRPPG